MPASPLLPRPVTCGVLSPLPSMVISKKPLEPAKGRRKSGQEVDFYWKEQKKNEQWVRCAKENESMVREESR